MEKFLNTLLFTVTLVDCSRILVISPSSAYSHQIIIQPIVQGLSERGHDVVFATTQPIRNKRLTNLKEIDLGFTTPLHATTCSAKRSVNILFKVVEFLTEITDAQLNHPEMQQLIKNETEHFDLVMFEYIAPTMSAFKLRFNCPLIGFTPLVGPNSDHMNFGNFDNPALYPNSLLYETFDNTFLQRIHNVYVSTMFELHRKFVVYPRANEIVRSHFGEMYPHVGKMFEDADMFFVMSNVLSPIRPITPSTILIGGGIQIRESKELPPTIKTFLNNSKRGVVYINFGTLVDSSKFPPHLIQMFLETIAELPYDFLWKFEEDKVFPKKSENLLTMKWVPQQDVLRHTNMKLFITHAGLHSFEEAVYFGVPMLAVPFFADQPYNAYRIAEKKIGLMIDDLETLTCIRLKNTILELLENSLYLENVRRFGRIVKDEPMKPIERAIWWTEYVLRHKGAKHLKGPIVPFYQRFLLDVFVFCILLLVLLVFSVCFIFKLLHYGKKYLIINKLKLN